MTIDANHKEFQYEVYIINSIYFGTNKDPGIINIDLESYLINKKQKTDNIKTNLLNHQEIQDQEIMDKAAVFDTGKNLLQ